MLPRKVSIMRFYQYSIINGYFKTFLLKVMVIVFIISLSVPISFVFADTASPTKKTGLDPRSSTSSVSAKTPCEIWSQSLPKDKKETRVCTDLYEGLPLAVLEKEDDCVKEGIGRRNPQTGKIEEAGEKDRICYALLTSSGISGFQAFIGTIYRFASLAIGIVGVLMIIVAGIQITIGGASPDQVASGKKRIIQIIAGMVLFYLIGAILRALNPSFFT